MPLTFIAKDPATDDDNCPTVWVDEPAQEIVIQGWDADEKTKAECLIVGPIPVGESVVRVPFRLIPAMREAFDVAERSVVR